MYYLYEYIIKQKYACLLTILILLPFCSPNSEEKETSKQQIHIRLPHDPENLNPLSYDYTYALQIVSLLFQSLLNTDYPDGKFRPVLAQDLPSISLKDSLAYITYQIRQEAVWDNGTPITAQDVAFSYKAIKCPLVNNEKLRLRYEFVRNVQTYPTEPKKITIICDRNTPNMESLTGNLFILPAYVFDSSGLLANYHLPQLTNSSNSLQDDPTIVSFAKIVNNERFARQSEMLQGSGGYKLSEWKKGQYVILKRKEKWWADALPNLLPYIQANPPFINFQIIPDNTTALLALKSGQLEVYDNIPANEFSQLMQDQKMKDMYNFYTPDTYDFSFIGINSRLEKFADKRTRQAIAHLLDIDQIIKVTQKQYATRTIGLVKPGDVNYNASVNQYPYNPAKAVELLKQAGWKQQSGKWLKTFGKQLITLTITVLYKAGNTNNENTALILRQAAAQIGIPVDVQPMEAASLTERLKAHRFEVFIRGLSGSPGEYDFKPILHSESASIDGGNYTGFGTPESDSLIEAINTTSDSNQRKKYLLRFQEILYDESTLLFMYVIKNRIAVSKRIADVKMLTNKQGYDAATFVLK